MMSDDGAGLELDASTVPGFLVQALFQVLHAEGIDPGGYSSTRKLALCEPGEFTLPFADFGRLLQSLSPSVHRRALGLAVGEQICESNLHAMGPVIVASRTMRDAFANVRALSRSMQLLPFGRVSECDGACHYVLNETSLGPIWEDMIVALCFHCARRFAVSALSGRNDLHDAIFARFARARPDNAAEYERCFRGRVTFEAGANGVNLPAGLVDQPRPGTDAALATELRRVIASRLRPRAGGKPWTARLEGALKERGELVNIDFERLANRWNISPRTLRRRVAAEGESVYGVLERVRFDRARQYLQQRSVTLQQVAVLLGYSEATSFRRAFKRWSGQSPGEYRQRLPANSDASS